MKKWAWVKSKTGEYQWEEIMEEVKIYEKDIQEAYKKGCEDVKKTLRCLYPGLRLGEDKEEYYRSTDLTVDLYGQSNSLYLNIRLPNSRNLISANCCKDEGGYIWVPFQKRDGIEFGNVQNFKIRKRR